MIEVLVWLLVITHDSYSGSTTIERFKSQKQCQHVADSLGGSEVRIKRQCIQANIYIQDTK